MRKLTSGRTLALAAMLALLPPSHVRAQAPADHGPARVHAIYGRSTYYRERLDGRPTSSGEIYHREGFTAAHLSLPFGSLVRVTNLRNGHSTVVRITDRGPFDRRFQIDVSGGAAELLGFYREMVTRVRLDVLRLGPDSLTEIGRRDSALIRSLKAIRLPGF